MSDLAHGLSLLTPKQISKSPTKKTDTASEFRIQGTDGIRCEVKASYSSEVTGLTPQEAFLKLGFITEEFMELYAYAHVKRLLHEGKAKAGDDVVVGWDPRDPRGNFTSAVVSGICKAGANALILGVVPTPLVPMYMLYKKAYSGFMVTASHNPKDQNGIKIFSSFRGLKLLPENDLTLTCDVLDIDFSTLGKLSIKGKRIDSRREALKIFHQFSLAPENTWISPERANHIFKDITLVVDAANGSLSGIAAETFRQAGFGKVIEVNAKLNGDVNLKSGVADLEGKTLITADMTQKNTGIFSEHLAITKLFELGRKNRIPVTEGKKKVCGAVFDADGDRFYRLEYDASKDAIIVLSGDETAFLQASYLMATDPKRYKGKRYINTVESDLGTAVAVEKLGFRPVLTSVGDKWILLKIATLMAEDRIREIKKSSGSKPPSAKLLKKWKGMLENNYLDVTKFHELEAKLDFFAKNNKAKKNIASPNENNYFSFAIGSEETGHNITNGSLTLEDGRRISVLLGNGLKSAINTFVATQLLLESKPVRTYFSTLANPFPSGFKQTLYAYYVKKDLFKKNSLIWNRLKQSVHEEAQSKGFNLRITNFPEEPDMLYISLTSKDGGRGAVFVRNSGTENKIGVNLRGSKKDAAKLKSIGQQVVKTLLSSMKDPENPFYKLEQDILTQLKGGPMQAAKLKLKKATGGRVLSEMTKQKLIGLTTKGYALTPLGKWHRSEQNRNR
ncbi:MAG: hypothetical protein CMH80_03785 [Nitrospinae bacterium]|nr:hypothetical protein [Nitrospinota bacterium]